MAPLSEDQQTTPSLTASLALPAEAPQLTTAAMERFACLAERCSDTCCRDFTVALDRGSLDDMKERLARTPDGAERLLRLVVIGRPSRHADGAAAQLQTGANGACALLQEDRRCGVHATAGEEALPTSCSVFPRTSLAVAGRLEVGGSLACPEVARLTLLSDEAPMLKPASRPMLPRAYVGKTVPSEGENLYAQRFLEVRAVLLRLLGAGGRPLASRVAFAAHLADRLQPFFNGETAHGETAHGETAHGDAAHGETGRFQGAARVFAERRLGAELRAAEDEATLAAIDRDLRLVQSPGEPVLGLATTLLLGRLRFPHAARYRSLIDHSFSSLAEEALGRKTTPEDAVPPARIWEIYRQRRDRLEARAGGRGTFVFGNWAQNHLLRHPYTESASLLEYLYGMTVELAALRLLFVGHPAIGALLGASADEARDREQIDHAAVDVVQTVTKTLGHSPDYLEATLGTAAAAGVGFGRLVLIAKFL